MRFRGRVEAIIAIPPSAWMSSLTPPVADGYMWIKRLTQFLSTLYHNPTFRIVLLTVYYLAIITGLIIMYGRGNFTTPKFVYQGF